MTTSAVFTTSYTSDRLYLSQFSKGLDISTPPSGVAYQRAMLELISPPPGGKG